VPPPATALILFFRSLVAPPVALTKPLPPFPSDDRDPGDAQGVQDGLQPGKREEGGPAGKQRPQQSAAQTQGAALPQRDPPPPTRPFPFFRSHLPSTPPHTHQTHFVRNETFKKAADSIQGPARKIFIEFLERSCTAEFSGFLLYKELARRLKKTNPAVAEIFALLSRDEARHAGFINKALADFNLALDLGFLTKNRTYT